MLSTFVSCAVIVAVSPSIALPEAKPNTTTRPAPTTTKPVATKPAATAPAKSQPQTHTVNRPVSEPTKSTPAAKAAKFEILAIERSIVDSTNAQRAQYGLPALVIDPNLMATARQHGNWMASYRQFSHSNIGVAENIAMGQSSTQEVLSTWMNSSGHRANILNGWNHRIGVSAYRSPDGTIFWCQQFMP